MVGKDSEAFHIMLFEFKERYEGPMQRDSGSSLLGAAEMALNWLLWGLLLP